MSNGSDPRQAWGYVVDDGGPDKAAAGGAGPFAVALAERPVDEQAHLHNCPTCAVIGEPLRCVGLIPAPLSQEAERWLVDRLPADIDGLPGFLLRKAIGDFGYEGDEGRRLRDEGLLAAPGPYTRHFGPFFRRFTVSSEQLLEEMLCAGDVDPAHALAILVHLGALEVDGALPLSLDDGTKLGELIERPESRRARTRCTVIATEDADAGVLALQRYLIALHAAFVVDAPVRLFGP
jgi:hypothetical protein